MRPSATSDDVTDVFDKSLANEGLLATDSKMPASLSDRGPQMRSKTIRRFFYDLGIAQMFSRPRTPADNRIKVLPHGAASRHSVHSIEWRPTFRVDIAQLSGTNGRRRWISDDRRADGNPRSSYEPPMKMNLMFASCRQISSAPETAGVA